MTFVKLFKHDTDTINDCLGTYYPLDTQINRYAKNNNVQPISVSVRTIYNDMSEALVIFAETEGR